MLAIAGCAGPSPVPAPEHTAVSADPAQAARTAEAAGDYRAAARAWQTLAAGAGSPDREAYQLRAAAAWLTAGDAARSRAVLAQTDVAKLGDALIARKQILLARLAFGRDDPVAAAAALARPCRPPVATSWPCCCPTAASWTSPRRPSPPAWWRRVWPTRQVRRCVSTPAGTMP
jgi:hypothetical protein